MAKKSVNPARRPRPAAPSTAATQVASASQATSRGGEGVMSMVERAQRPVLAATYWFNPPADQEAQPYPVTIRFSGQRAGSEKSPQQGDAFTHEHTIDRVVPGSGPIALTARIHGVNPGEWNVTAGAVEAAVSERRDRLHRFKQKREREQVTTQPFAGTALVLPRIWLNWAPPVNVAEGTAAPIPTRLEPFIRIPGTLPYIWITLVIVGMIVALITQAQLIARVHLPIWTVTICTILALAVGAVGAKVWHVFKHRNHPEEQGVAGWMIQGMIVGATATAIIAFWVAGVPLGVALDASAPGLMFGMAIGRVGCFLAGCCGGPPTAARWGVWSSDQHVGARRVPTQLMESLFCLLGGLATLAVFLAHGPANGAIFVAAVAAYTLFREWLLRIRVEKYETPLPQLVIPVVSALALIGSVIYIVIPRGT